MAEDWLTTVEAAEFSGYHREYLRELIREGKLAARRFGSVWAIDKTSLLAFLEAARKSRDRRRGPK